MYNHPHKHIKQKKAYCGSAAAALLAAASAAAAANRVASCCSRIASCSQTGTVYTSGMISPRSFFTSWLGKSL